MPQAVKVHEVFYTNKLEHDEWYLVRDLTGRRYVLYESHRLDPISHTPHYSKQHQIAIKTILAQNNVLAHKLMFALEERP